MSKVKLRLALIKPLKAMAIILGILLLLMALVPSSIPKAERTLMQDSIDSASAIRAISFSTEIISGAPKDLSEIKVIQETQLGEQDIKRISKIISSQSLFESWLGVVIFCDNPKNALVLDFIDKRQEIIWVSFHCHKIRFNSRAAFEMPPFWLLRLRELFEKAGISTQEPIT